MSTLPSMASHPVIALHTEGTPYTLDILYWECAKGMYSAGSRGTVAGPTRRPVQVERA